MTEIANDEIRRKLGNLTQIRELLFGEQIEDFNHRFNQYQKQLETLDSQVKNLESDLEKFKSEQKQSLNQLQSDLSDEISNGINSLEKKLQYLGLNTSNEVTRINKDIEAKTQRNSQIIDAISKKFDSQNQNIRSEIGQTKASLEKEIFSLKQELLTLLEQNLSDFSKSNISRHELADLLFKVCLRIKGNDVKGELFDLTSNNQEMKAELILPGDSEH